jgi:hypothetical protein
MSYDKNQDRVDSERYTTQTENVRREDAAALNGATLGILLALAIASAIGAFFFLSSRNDTAPTVPAISPSTIPSTAPPEKQTIIREEKTRELVPVPQTTTQPNINITIPSAPNSPSVAAPSSPPAAVAPSDSNDAPSSSSAQSPAPVESPSASPGT